MYGSTLPQHPRGDSLFFSFFPINPPSFFKKNKKFCGYAAAITAVANILGVSKRLTEDG